MFFGVQRAYWPCLTARWPRLFPTRMTSLADLDAICDLLEHDLKADRVREVIRRPAVGLDDRSLLDVIAADGTAVALAATREMFDFGDVGPGPTRRGVLRTLATDDDIALADSIARNMALEAQYLPASTYDEVVEVIVLHRLDKEGGESDQG